MTNLWEPGASLCPQSRSIPELPAKAESAEAFITDRRVTVSEKLFRKLSGMHGTFLRHPSR